MIITQPAIVLEGKELTLLNNAMELCERIFEDCPEGDKFNSFLQNAENAQYHLNELLKDYNKIHDNED